jgi:hypothetical protein
MFAAQTSNHRIDHRNFQFGQRAAARLHLIRDLYSFHLVRLRHSAIRMPPIRIDIAEELRGSARFLLRINREMRIASAIAPEISLVRVLYIQELGAEK